MANSAYETCLNACEDKANTLPWPNMGAKSILAGMYIALGCMMMLLVRSDTSLSPAVSSILSGLCFSIGLFAVMTCNGELFTGDCLMILGALDQKYGPRTLICTLLHVFTWNLVGSAIMFMIFDAAGLCDTLEEGILAVSQAKMALDVPKLFARSVLCNFLVCMSVWIGSQTDEIGGKLVAAVVPVACFVALGFEHSIANIFLYFAMDSEPIWLLRSLLVCTFGNVVGGMGLFATFQRCANAKFDGLGAR